MSEVIETVEVDVPVRVAYDQWTQFESFPQFMEGVSQVRQQDDTHTHWVIDIGGQRREFDAVITEQIPDERIAWRSTDGATHAGVVTFHRLDDTRSRVTLQLETVPEGIVEKLGDKLGIVKTRAKGDMKKFKEFIESRGVATGAYRGSVPQGQDTGRPGAVPPGEPGRPSPGGTGRPGPVPPGGAFPPGRSS
ncbi:SRPBCC family protein [Marinactinospora thermotolerans]|uniref:SRPBCC family protein n=1 Tax=Marinactinospora thermotolerans TaxID=531310 RepID=UPI003D8A4ABB